MARCYGTELKPGWLKRQIKNVKQDMARWPKWMKQGTDCPHFERKEA